MLKSNRVSAILGTLIIVGILYFGVLKNAANPLLYLDAHALILVILGTLAVSLIAFPIQKIDDLVNFVVFGIYFSKVKKKKEKLHLAIEMVEAMDLKMRGQSLLEGKYKTAYVREYLSALEKVDMSSEYLIEILEHKKEAMTQKYYDDAKTLVAISKFPPALGLLGASTGMIEMMQQIGGDGGTAAIGKSMATALVATFWGIAMANFVILPLSDLATKLAEEEDENRQFVIEFVYFMKNNFPIDNIVEFLLSKLPLSDRIILRAEIKKYREINALFEQTRTPFISPIDGLTSTNIIKLSDKKVSNS
jgi:chemotaxis protein MotA